MQSIVGVFTSCAAADRAVREMLDKGIPPQSLIFLTSEQLPAEVERVPTTDAEAHGMGKAIGAFVGGVVGASAGLGLGSAVASLVVPGVGTILAAGLGPHLCSVLAAPLREKRLAIAPKMPWIKACPATMCFSTANC